MSLHAMSNAFSIIKDEPTWVNFNLIIKFTSTIRSNKKFKKI